MVRLVENNLKQTKWQLKCFNSTMVRLVVKLPSIADNLSVLCFNSTMVRLVGNFPDKNSFDLPSFNSTMVRLVVGVVGSEKNRVLVSIPLWYDW